MERQKLFLESIDINYTFDARDEKVQNGHPDDDPEDEVEFRLFAAPSNVKNTAGGGVARIKLSSPGPSTDEIGLLRARPQSFYFTGSPSRSEEIQLRAAAITGDQVINLSRRAWPGLQMPWRVISVDGQSKVSSMLNNLASTGSRPKRTRLGKKGRIAVRMRAQKQKRASEDAKKAAADKELQERMKKSKKNRDKKLRQREKEKVKKAAARAEAEQAPPST